MSKRLILFTLILTVTAFPLMAAESGPSNTVGFLTWDCPVGYAAFSFPLTYYTEGYALTYDLNDIIGPDQFTGFFLPDGADQIMNIETGAMAWKDASGVWQNSVNIEVGYAYYAIIRSGHNPVDAVTAGEVDMSPMPTFNFPVGYTAFGWREPGAISIEDLGLMEAGFTGGFLPDMSDKVIDINSGATAYYITTGPLEGWQGGLTALTPTSAYYIIVNNTAFDYTYTSPGAGGNGGFDLSSGKNQTPPKVENVRAPNQTPGGLRNASYKAQKAAN